MKRLVGINYEKAEVIKTKPMSEMKPLEVGVIHEPDESYHNFVVMRTASIDKFEVMILSEPDLDHCWTTPNSLPVRAYESNTITLYFK